MIDAEPASDGVQATDLDALARRIESLAARRLTTDPIGYDARRRATQLDDHVRGHIVPRARSLDAPIVVLVLGPTGSGKSSIVNALAGRSVTRTGVLRPTTRHLVARLHPDDADAMLEPPGPLAGVDADSRTVVADERAPRGIVLIDAPDIDSIERENRRLADRLAESADLCLFVTTATRYADRVAWEVLRRVRDRGLPVVVVANRLPDDAADGQIVVDDLRRLLGDEGITEGPGGDRLEIVPIEEGAIDVATDGLRADAIAPIQARLEALAADRDARRALAAEALAGSLAGLAPLLDQIADDLAHESIEVEAMRRTAHDHFQAEIGSLREAVQRGTFLREAALRQWQAFVGADEVTRLFSEGIGKVRGTLSALVRGTPRAPVAEVREDAVSDLAALARAHAAEASRRAASDWARRPPPGPAAAEDAALWTVSPDFEPRTRALLEGWVSSIGEDVQATGRPKRRWARAGTIGVNAAGVAVMLTTFSHTGGLTGAEVGIAAATAFLNQKLLAALFGEAAMVELIQRARRRLVDAFETAFGYELERFDRAAGDPGERQRLEGELRDAARDVRQLPPFVPATAVPVMAEPAADGVHAAVGARDATEAHRS